jgi:hypothetical protein
MVGLDRIGFECDDKELTEELLNVPHGISLVTGPTGSGKEHDPLLDAGASEQTGGEYCHH